jgi:undecaprenyl-diphosphatase
LAWVAVAVTVIVLTARWVSRHPGHLGGRCRPATILTPALLALLAGLSAAGWACGLFVQEVQSEAIDQPVIRYLAGHRVAWLTTAMHGATWLGSTVVLVLFVVVAGLAVRRQVGHWAAGAQLVLALGGAIALNNLIKPLVGRLRPDVDPLVSTVSGFAFPSGHATQTAAVAVTLALLASVLIRSRSWRVGIGSAAVSITLVVAFSRVYLGVHWPTDVFAGCALGGLWAVLTAGALRWSGRTAAEGAPGEQDGRWATLEETG